MVTCVEADHLDNYADLAQIEAAFRAFAAKISAGGLLVACADDPGAPELAAAGGRRPGADLRVLTYGDRRRRRLPGHRRPPRGHGAPA